MKKMIKKHSDDNWAKSFRRYVLIDYVLGANSWADLEQKLNSSKVYSKDCPAIMGRMFNEFKFYNCVSRIEFAITDSLNRFLIEESKIKNWEVLKKVFLDKIKKNTKSTKEEAEKIIEKQINGKMHRILTPHMMLYCAGFGVGELVGYVNSLTKDFSQKKELIEKLVKFNEIRKLVIHNPLTSREDVGEEIRKGVELGKEIISLIEEITREKIEKFA